MREVLRITIIIDADGQASCAGPAGSPLQAPVAPPAGPDPSTAEYALSMLRDAGVQDPEALVKIYPAQRIVEVCIMAGERAEKLKNKAGWINAALRRAWTK